MTRTRMILVLAGVVVGIALVVGGVPMSTVLPFAFVGAMLLMHLGGHGGHGGGHGGGHPGPQARREDQVQDTDSR